MLISQRLLHCLSLIMATKVRPLRRRRTFQSGTLFVGLQDRRSLNGFDSIKKNKKIKKTSPHLENLGSGGGLTV